MTAGVRWVDYDERVATVSADDVRAVEEHLGIRLPHDYVTVLLEHAGRSTEPETVAVGGRTRVFGTLYFVSKEARVRHHYNNAYKALDDLRDWGGERWSRVFPFASNTASGLYCFDYRETTDAPPVIYLDLQSDSDEEGSVARLAGSFTELLTKLR